jgi:uncharacterized protein YjbI with pentapeptide repeats
MTTPIPQQLAAEIDCSLAGPPPYNCEGCDLSGRDLAGKDLTNANLQRTTLTGTRFRGVVGLRGADFTRAIIGNGTDFSGCDLSAAVLPQGIFNSAATDGAKPVLLVRATIPFAALGLTWSNLDLTGATIVGLPHDLTRLEVTCGDLTRFDFSQKILANAHFRSVVLRSVDFSGSTLDNVVFDRATNVGTNLTGAKFGTAKIRGHADFDTAILTNADFTGATLEAASFLNARMDGTIFDGTDLTGCQFSPQPFWSTDAKQRTSFKNAKVNYSDLRKDWSWSYLDLTDVKLVGLDRTVDLSWLMARHAVLTRMKLDGFTLVSCDFSDAILEGASFIKADLRQAALDRASGGNTHFRNATLTEAQLVGVSLPGADMTGADLRQADLSYSDLSGGVFKGARLQGDSEFRAAILSDAQLVNANFEGANLTSAQFPGAYVWGQQVSFAGATVLNVNFDGAYLVGVKFIDVGQRACRGSSFDGACLINAVFNGTDLRRGDNGKPTSFVRACLQGVDFTDALLEGADMTGAAVAATGGQFFARILTGSPPQPITIPLMFQPTLGIEAATDFSTACPAGGPGPCTAAKQAAPDAPTTWPVTLGANTKKPDRSGSGNR